MDSWLKAWRTWVLSAMLAIATFAAYIPVAQSDFIKFDDGFYVVHNRRVTTGLSWANLGWAFRSGYQGNWHPVTWLSHMLDVQFFGMRPGWHHLTNLVLHAGSAVLLFLWLQWVTGTTWRSLSVAGLFALHPLHVESVAWISERKDVLSTFFLLLTLLAYTAYARAARPAASTGSADSGSVSPRTTPGPQRAPLSVKGPFICALILFALGLMSKAMLVTVPFLLLLIDFWPLGRFASPNPPRTVLNGLLREKVLFFALTVVSCVVTVLAQERGNATYLGLPLDARVVNAIPAYWIYLAKTIWPIHLAVFYPHPYAGAAGAHFWPAGCLLGGMAGLLIISVAAFSWRGSAPWFTVGWFWFLGTLVPVIGVIQVGGQAMADRYTYIPLIGIFLCAVWGVSRLQERWRVPAPALAGMAITVLVLCALTTYRQATFWRDDFTLFAHALSATRNNSQAHYHVGIGYEQQGQKTKALTEFRAAAADDLTYGAGPYEEIGTILEEQGKTRQALAIFEQAARVLPWAAERLHNKVAGRLWTQGKYQEAIAQYEAALSCNPDYPEARFNFGIALAGLGQFDKAALQFAVAYRLRPDDSEALGCLAEALMKAGHKTEAEERFREQIQLAPTNAIAHQNLGLLLVQRGSMDQALAEFQKAVDLDPNWPDALNALAWLLATHPSVQFRNPGEAVKLAQRACELAGGKQSRFWGTLDIAYAGAGRFSDAIQAATKAQELATAEGQTNAAQAAAVRIQEYQQHLGK